MMTQTHFLVAAALFAKPGKARLSAAALAGSLAPDAAIYVLFVWSKLAGIPEMLLWQEIYFSEPMLTFTAIGNSLPLYTSFLAIGVVLAGAKGNMINDKPPVPKTIGGGDLWLKSLRARTTNSAFALFALGALTHLAGDFLVHARDAHPHFWPLTVWKFHSPVSYWDSDHFGDQFAIFEMVLGVVLAAILYRRFKAGWVRLLCGLAAGAYVGVPLYFRTVLG